MTTLVMRAYEFGNDIKCTCSCISSCINDGNTGADKSHCLTSWSSAFIGRASGFVVHSFIRDK